MRKIGMILAGLAFAGSAAAMELKPSLVANHVAVEDVSLKLVSMNYGYHTYQVLASVTSSNECAAPSKDELVAVNRYTQEGLDIDLGQLETDRHCLALYRPVTQLISVTYVLDRMAPRVTVNGVLGELDTTDAELVVDVELDDDNLAGRMSVDSASVELIPQSIIPPHSAPEVAMMGYVKAVANFSNDCMAPLESELGVIKSKSMDTMEFTLFQKLGNRVCAAIYDPVDVEIDVWSGRLFEERHFFVNGVEAE